MNDKRLTWALFQAAVSGAVRAVTGWIFEKFIDSL